MVGEWRETTNHNPMLVTKTNEIELRSLIDPLYEHQDQFIKVFSLYKYVTPIIIMCTVHFMSKNKAFFFSVLFHRLVYTDNELHYSKVSVRRFSFYCVLLSSGSTVFLAPFFHFSLYGFNLTKRAPDEGKYVTDILLPNKTTMEDCIRFQSVRQEVG